MRTLARRTGIVLALSAVTVLSVAACAESGAGSDPSTPGGLALVTDGALTTCTQLPYRPFEFTDDGKIVGFDIDVVDEIAADLDLRQELVDTPFEGIQTGEDLNTAKCDIAAAGITITDARKKVIDFSESYFEATQALLVPKDSTITSLGDLDGKKLGVQAGTTGKFYAEEKATGAELVQFDDLGSLETAVQTGRVDAAINDNGVLIDFAGSNDDVVVVAEFDTGEQYGLGVKLGNTALLEAANATLARMKTDGTYDALYAKWFKDAPVSAGTPTPAAS